MKNYIQPELEVIKVNSEDIIQTSGLNAGEGNISGGSGPKWD